MAQRWPWDAGAECRYGGGEMATRASEHPNVTRVRALFSAFSATPPEDAHQLILDAFHDDTVWHVLGAVDPLTGRYDGRSELIERVFHPMYEGSGYTWSVEPLEFIAAGDELVLVHMRETATIAGETHTGHVAVVLRMAGGRIAEGLRMPDSSLDGHWARAAASARS